MTSVASRLNVPISFEFSRRLGPTAEPRPAFAFAGIAKPERFYSDLERAGWHLTGRRSFRDHHRYSTQNVREVARAAKESGAHMLVTTEKDQVRLPPQVGRAADCRDSSRDRYRLVFQAVARGTVAGSPVG